jgi:archaellum biogenesis ATPase FlaH
MDTESTSPQEPKVFISYSHDSEMHQDRVLSLSDRLRLDGVDCSIDRYVQSPQQGWPTWMLDQIQTANYILVVCTENYFSPTEKERIVSWQGAIITQRLFETDPNKRFIPVIFSENDSQYILSFIKGQTCYKLDTAEGYDLLYRLLTDQPETPALPLGNRRNLPPRRRFPTRQFCNLPDPTYRKFISRQTEINEILNYISPIIGQTITVIRGIGGVGKTALAVEVAYRCLDARLNPSTDLNNEVPTFDAVIFTTSKETDFIGTQMIERPKKESTLLDIFRVISETLQESNITQVPEDQQQKNVIEALRQKGKTLLIVDNFETISDKKSIWKFLNALPPETKIIITTREDSDHNQVELGALDELESYDLIQTQAKEKEITINEENQQQIYSKFGGIPMALIYSVGKLAAGYSLNEILDSNISDRDDIGRFCFEDSVKPLRGTPAHQLLMTMTFFSVPPNQKALLKVAGFTSSPNLQEDALKNLQKLSLVDTKVVGKDTRFTILPMTREYARAELQTPELKLADFETEARNRLFDWYLEFTNKYGGKDEEGWRAQYDHLESEWLNIEPILYYHKQQDNWERVYRLWLNVDSYVDLTGYWQIRHEWWTYIAEQAQNKANLAIYLEALSEKCWTDILMGTENHENAKNELLNAMKYLSDYRSSVSMLVFARIANHLAVIAKGESQSQERDEYNDAIQSLNQGTNILAQYSDTNKTRYQIENQYYLAEVYYLQGKLLEAKQILEKIIAQCQEIKWQRFLNYANNSLADILIDEGNDLKTAKYLIEEGKFVAGNSKETRRIAMYNLTYARLEEKQGNLELAAKYGQEALKVFKKERMVFEEKKANDLLARANAV